MCYSISQKSSSQTRRSTDAPVGAPVSGTLDGADRLQPTTDKNNATNNPLDRIPECRGYRRYAPPDSRSTDRALARGCPLVGRAKLRFRSSSGVRPTRGPLGRQKESSYLGLFNERATNQRR